MLVTSGMERRRQEARAGGVAGRVQASPGDTGGTGWKGRPLFGVALRLAQAWLFPQGARPYTVLALL